MNEPSMSAPGRDLTGNLAETNGRASHRAGRRTIVKGALIVTGAALGSAYVKPSLRSLGVPAALATTSGPPPPPPFIWAESGTGVATGPSSLFQVVPSPTGGDKLVGLIQTNSGSQPIITDLAQDQNGNLFAVSFDTLFRVDKSTGKATQVGTGLGVSGVNALGFDAAGNLFGATFSGEFLRINPTTGTAGVVGSYGSGLQSSGDLVFANGFLFGTAKAPSVSDDVLVIINEFTGQATRVNPVNTLGFNNVFGLAVSSGQVFGLTAGASQCSGGVGALIQVNTVTGTSTFVRCLSFIDFGAASAEI